MGQIKKTASSPFIHPHVISNGMPSVKEDILKKVFAVFVHYYES